MNDDDVHDVDGDDDEDVDDDDDDDDDVHDVDGDDVDKLLILPSCQVDMLNILTSLFNKFLDKDTNLYLLTQNDLNISFFVSKK